MDSVLTVQSRYSERKCTYGPYGPYDDTCVWTPNKFSTGASREAPVDNECFSISQLDLGTLRYPRYPSGDGRSWFTGYWQLGLGTLGILGAQAATANPGLQAIGSWA